MGLLRSILQSGQRALGIQRVDAPHTPLRRGHICRFEQFEARLPMAADLHVGSVYYEQAGGDDAVPNLIQFTFEGGAANSQLTRIVIDGDKDGLGRSSGDIFFDTAPGGLGSFKSNPFKVVSHDGFEVLGAQVVDGGMRMVIDLAGFDAGEKLIISIDVDESQFVDPQNGDIDTNAVAEGGEFQRSHFYATFKAPHYEDITTHVQFWDEYDQRFATVENSTGHHLNLPPDRYDQSKDLADFTAGAVAQAKQIPLPNSISGVVFVDQNLNNHQDTGEKGLGNVNLTLLVFDGATYVSTGLTTVTDTLGNYKFDKLAIGKFRVVETQPLGYFSVGAQAGKVDGATRGVVVNPDIVSEIDLLGGENSVHNDFAEALPNSISGYVHADKDADCVFDPDEKGIANVVIRLLDAQGNIIRTTKTNADGYYEFTDLAPGTYGVFEEQPAGYLNQGNQVGTAGGVKGPQDTVTQIVLPSDIHGLHYDFCEVEPGGISGFVNVDLDVDCVTDPGEPPIAGVVIRLLDANGNTIATTTTDVNGFYKFENLRPGTYGVFEEQPAGYLNGCNNVGTIGGTLGVDTVTAILLPPGTMGEHYDFRELEPAQISGRVHVNTTGDCADPTNPPLQGVTVELLNSSNVVVATTVTDAEGMYYFRDLHPGTYSVHEIQPQGYFNGATFVGTAGGVKGVDLVTSIVLPSGADGLHYDFCEIPPAMLCGFVYVDLNNNGLREAGEMGIAGVTLRLLDADGNSTGITTTTDNTGEYCFTELRPGTYSVVEVQPNGYLDGLDTPGTAGGVAQNPGDRISGILLKPAAHSEDNNFGELLPASISGKVHMNTTGDCADPTNPPLSGVTVQLLNANGTVIGSTLTDADGMYYFRDLPSGNYSVRELQPNGYFNGATYVGSVGGVKSTDLVTNIVLLAGVNAVHYDFCEIPPVLLSGNVFQDGPPIPLPDQSQPIYVPDFRDGKLTSDDTLLPGVLLMLRDGVTGAPILGSAALPGTYAADQPITVTTDAHGHYEFVGLKPGTYAVYELSPGGYIRGIDTAGSLGGIVISAWTTVDPAVLDLLQAPMPEDAILQISLLGGQSSINNNFSVVVTTGQVQVFVLPPPPPGQEPPAPLNGFVAPPPLPPLIPQLLPQQLPAVPRRAGGQLYTWHLSVIDAGQPRSADGDAAQFQLTSAQAEEVSWLEGDMNEAEWTLVTDIGNPASARKLRFGMKGGIPIAGDFNGDGTFEVGIFKEGRWYIDLNDNGVWDEGDLWAKLGHRGDLPVAGDWDGDAKTDIGIYGPAWLRDPRAIAHEPGLPDPDNVTRAEHKNIPRAPHRTTVGNRELKLTSTGKRREDVIDHVFLYGTPGDHPVVGDWNGDGIDTIAVFRDGRWHRDIDGDGKWTNSDVQEGFGQKGDVPVVGDFNGDGIEELGVYRNGTWYIDTNGNGVIDGEDKVFELGGPDDKPVVGDWDGDGTSDPGVFHGGAPAARTVRK